MEDWYRAVTSLQHTLIGEVPTDLRAAICSCKDKKIFIRFVFYEPISEQRIEDFQILTTEVISDFEDNYSIDEAFEVLSKEKDLHLNHGEHFAFLRKSE